MQTTSQLRSSGLDTHRVLAPDPLLPLCGEVRFAPAKAFWFFGMAGAAVVGGSLTFSWSAVILFAGSTALVLLFGHSLGSHRKLIHNSFGCPKWLEYALVYLGVQVGLAGPIGLLKQHDLRDYAQRLPECHDYLRHGQSFWRDGWWQLACELRVTTPIVFRLETSIAADPFYRWLERTWVLQHVGIGVLFYAWGGWAFVFWGVCARVTTTVFGHWLIGYFAHNHGEMVYQVRGAAVQGRNVRLTSLLTMGECWHNNHHAYPGSARLGLRADEWDPGWWMLMLFARLGLAWDFEVPASLPTRPELEIVGERTRPHLDGPSSLLTSHVLEGRR